MAASVRGLEGHTDFLADFFKRDVLMLLHGDLVSVIPLTIHVPLRDVPGRLREALDRPATFKVLSSLLEWPEFQKTRWALCGMNPHAGEEGHLGTEEIDFMNEAAARFRAGGLPLEGPVAADSAFMPEDRKYRLVLSAYHDQGLGPFKAIEGRGGINVTVGLPFFRASPDHGTAFEIAGKGIADPHS
ncbi:MAG: 4-hydroxythreonine-4-phosphate dehydrogenase PdxA, partial [Spirochaetia bacterium]|nr:4-hydroxythreonine-4-phosphate dehydrogenase PdxA [Spirochaetia bacterium]